MKLAKVFSIFSFTVAMALPMSLMAEDAALTVLDYPCQSRGFSYCTLPNTDGNCTITKCNASLSTSGSCTVEAVRNSSNEITSCRACASEAIECAACEALGGTCS